ncbi:hypothetical protein BH23CHL2_BH23CHL2_23870 [soil metagenome]
MPHIHGVDILARREKRTLARIDARWGWIAVRFECGFDHDDNLRVMHRWYRGLLWGGIVETWRVTPREGDLVDVSVAIRAPDWLRRVLARIVIAPIAARQMEMIELLAVAHRRSQEADGWD